MRIAPCLLSPALLLLSGCGYVHFGPAPVAPPATVVGDAELVRENAGLRQEKGILQQELALTRAQGEALRMAIENRAADGETSRQLVARLNESTRELATLRLSYAKLQSERDRAIAGPGDPALQARLGATEERLAVSLRSYTELQAEINRLRSDLMRARVENAALSARVKTMTAENELAQAALAQLNTDLLVQKEARYRAEQDAEAFRTELKVVAPNSSVLARQRAGSAGEARTLAPVSATEAVAVKRPVSPAAEPVAAPPAEQERVAAVPTVVEEAARIDLGSPSSPPAASANGNGAAARGASSVRATLVTTARTNGRMAATRAEPAGERSHVVTGGDTLAKISTQYYGTPARWGDILAANRDVLGEDNKLVVGRVLRIP